MTTTTNEDAYDWSLRAVISSMSLDDGCYYCGKKANTWDHIVPIARRGRPGYHNLVPCCRSCNSIKGDKPLYLFRQILKKRGLPHDFETPDPFPIYGTRYQKDNRFAKFISDDGKLIIDDFKIYIQRIYGNDRIRGSQKIYEPETWRDAECPSEVVTRSLLS